MAWTYNIFTGTFDKYRSESGLDDIYLRLDATNDPVTGDLTVNATFTASTILYNAGGHGNFGGFGTLAEYKNNGALNWAAVYYDIGYPSKWFAFYPSGAGNGQLVFFSYSDLANPLLNLGAGSDGIIIQPNSGGAIHLAGPIDAETNKISDVVDPTLDQDAATKKYVDDEITDIQTTTTLTVVNIDFTASSEEDVTISIGKEVRELLRGRLWIDTDPGADFEQWATVSLYNKSAKKGEDCFYRFDSKMVYTELEVATTGSDADITPDDHTLFSVNDLILFQDDDELARLATIADTMVAEDNVGSHAINTGISRVSEFSGFSMFDMESGTDVEMRISFSSAQTVSLKAELVVRT